VSRSRLGASLWASLRITIPAFLISRALVFAGTIAGYALLPRAHAAVDFSPAARTPLEPFFRADAQYYAAIARYGYGATTAAVPSPAYRAAFFPLYPLLARLLGGSNLVLLAIPSVAFLLALVFLHQVAVRHLDRGAARAVPWVAAFIPGAVFFSYPFTESIFLLAAVLCFWLLELDRLVLAGVAAAAAAAARSPGVLLILAFAAEAFQRRRILAAAGGAALCLAGAGAVIAVDAATVGSPFAFTRGQSNWISPSRGITSPLTAVAGAVVHLDPYRVEALGLPLLVVFLVASVWVARRLPPAYALYNGGVVLLSAATGLALHSFWSVPRYLLIAFPSYLAIAAGLAGRRPLRLGLLALAGVLLFWLAAVSGSGRFIG
jgi:hypothetical protein